jgi:hypothetical protein
MAGDNLNAILVERVVVSFKKSGAPLDGERLEGVKTLPEKYLNLLLDTVEKVENGSHGLRYAAVNDVYQIYLNDKTVAAMLKKGR